MHLQLPLPLASVVVGAFRRIYGIDLSDAVVPPCGFRSIGELFTRELLPNARKFPEDQSLVVSPIDGALRAASAASAGEIEVKNQRYSVEHLLGGDQLAGRLKESLAFNFYLSPPDYHRVHAPAGGKIIKSRYIPGGLWPVNAWAFKNVPGLFVQNERLAIFMESELGLIALVMVGALNVGRISVTFDDWLTNSGKMPERLERAYSPEISVQRGQALGTFHMGSAVVLLIENGARLLANQRQLRAPGALRIGQALAA